MMNSKEQNLQIANTIWKEQISRNTLMCVGAHKPTVVENGIRFAVRVDNQRRYIEIVLNGRDLYDCSQVLCRGVKQTRKFKAVDVFCEDLDEVVYRLGSTRYPAKGFLEEVGIESVNEIL